MLNFKGKPLTFMLKGIVFMACTAMAEEAYSQADKLPLNNLSAFQNPGRSWQIAGDVTADLKKDNNLNTTDGTGILVNEPGRRNKGTDLFTNFEHGDMDLELDYMVAKGANSGIYLQGRYELQLEDSWGVNTPTSGNNGGIYERWDEQRPGGQKGFQGYAPRQNASKAPGLWQHLKISFQAPRFNASGQKIENAKILRAELNGVTIHEDLELLGPTRGAMGNDEKPTGPLRFQGDHGAVAFRNINITPYEKPRPELLNLKYTVFKGRYEAEPLYDSIPPEAEGTAPILTSNLRDIPKQFLIRYTGTLRVKEPGEYNLRMNTPGGRGAIKINNQEIVQLSGRGRSGKVTLPAGEFPFELLYTKLEDWAPPALGLSVAGPGIRDYIISEVYTTGSTSVDPIFVNAPENTILRSFMDLPATEDKKPMRVVHAVNVGSPRNVHYTYDMDTGMLLQLWRGGFLDATPMWHSRGDGSSRPVGAVQHLGRPAFTLARLASNQAAWPSDTAGTGFRPKGYVLDNTDQPTFTYLLGGATVSDAIRVMDNGHGIRRELTVQNPSGGMYALLAAGDTIESLSKDTYLVDGKSYYVRMEDAGGEKPFIRESGGRKELLVPVRGKLSYSILF